MRFNSRSTHKGVSNLFILTMFAGLIMLNVSAQASFATPNLTSLPYTCPTKHKMYVVAVNPRSYTPKATLPLIWKAGTEKKSFEFEGNKKLTITFSNLVDEINPNTNPFFGAGIGSGPANGTYDSGNENTVDAINTRHGNSVGQNHILNLQVNRNVSKIGYKIQDIDSNGNDFVRYQQRVDVSDNGGVFDSLSFNSKLQNINSNNNIITAIALEECDLGKCVIDTSWRYTAANDSVSLKHSNVRKDSIALNRNHIVGYSDFYFCLAPPKIIVNTLLDGKRVDDNDQFRIELSQSSDAEVIEAFTTTGLGSNVTDNTTITTLKDGFDYTVSERIINGKLLDYSTTYTCSNATTGSDVTFSSGPMKVNAEENFRTFSINNVGYGDEITCDVTNTPATYIFSGIVFNDNGGLPDVQADTNNQNYFDGKFNPTSPNAEAGISGSIIDLTNCSGTIYASQTVNANGTYLLNATTAQTAGNTNLCLVERRNDSDFPIRTTKDRKTLAITAAKDVYPDNNFGRVTAANAALTLKKYQHVNDCSPTLDYSSITTSLDSTFTPKDGFSTQPISDIQPNECIAYKITATNRSNLSINNFVLTDVLQNSVRVEPTFNATDYTQDSVAIGSKGNVETNKLILPARSKRDFYFNTKYDSAK